MVRAGRSGWDGRWLVNNRRPASPRLIAIARGRSAANDSSLHKLPLQALQITLAYLQVPLTEFQLPSMRTAMIHRAFGTYRLPSRAPFRVFAPQRVA